MGDDGDEPGGAGCRAAELRQLREIAVAQP